MQKEHLAYCQAWGWIYCAWGCVEASGTGNTAQINRRMDSSKDQQILTTQSLKKLKLNGDWLSQQDSDPEHTSKSTMNYFKKGKLCLEWPSQS